jgi:hypothetical protein
MVKHPSVSLGTVISVSSTHEYSNEDAMANKRKSHIMGRRAGSVFEVVFYRLPTLEAL